MDRFSKNIFRNIFGKKARILAGIFIVLQFTGPLLLLFSGKINLDGDWRNADRDSTLIAPPAAETGEAVIQAYAARAFGWRGLFAVHTWIATKRESGREYTVHHVLGWNERRGLPVVVSMQDIPDRAWYGYTPEIFLDIRGERASELIDPVHAAIESYPRKSDYTPWPGPNSNTFIAHIGRHVPGLQLEMPSIAVGKDFLLNGNILDKPPSGQGIQFSLFGLFGFILSSIEGIEINLLGLVSGFDHDRLSLKMPGIGEIDLIHD